MILILIELLKNLLAKIKKKVRKDGFGNNPEGTKTLDYYVLNYIKGGSYATNAKICKS